jgi:hypothetical protein
VVQNIPDSLEISAKKGHKFNEEDVNELEGEIYFTLLLYGRAIRLKNFSFLPVVKLGKS